VTDNAPRIHISSAVVSVLPAHQTNVAHALSRIPGVEVFHQATSKIVIVMEAPESGVLGGRLAEIALLRGVLSANMVFEQAELLAELGE
jgi:nitrate reductase NapD